MTILNIRIVQIQSLAKKSVELGGSDHNLIGCPKTWDHYKLSSRYIANVFEEKHGQGQSIFKNRIEKYESAIKMEATLKLKDSMKKIKRPF